MNANRLAKQLIIALAMLVTLTACGPKPITFTEMPLFPPAKTGLLEGAYETPIDLTISDMKDALKDKFGKLSSQVYFLPKGLAWDVIYQFYQGKLTADGWKEETTLAQKNNCFQMVVWSRSGLGSNQAVAVAFLDSPTGTDSFLIIGLTAQPE